MPPAKIVIEPMERSLPVFGADYRSERIASFRKELDVPDDAPAPLDKIAKVRAEQLADLDAQEAVLRARYDMPVPDKPGERAARIAAAKAAQGIPSPSEVAKARADLQRPGGDFRPADTMAVPPIADAQPARTTPPPNAMRSVADGTIDELRALGLRLADLGHPYEGPMPSSEAEAQALLPQLRGRVFDLTKAAAQPKQALTVTKEPGHVKPDGTPFKPGHQVAAYERKCADHGLSTPQPIGSQDWNASMAAVGRPLCASHLKEALKGARK